MPKTAAGFEKDFNALKKDKKTLFEYLKHIPVATLETYFKKSEVPAEILSGILDTINNLSFSNDDDIKWAASYLTTLAKAENFDMTLMFVEDADRNAIKQIVDKLAKTSGDLSKAVSKAYSSE